MREQTPCPKRIALQGNLVPFDHFADFREFVDEQDDAAVGGLREAVQQLAEHGKELGAVAALVAAGGKELVGQAAQVLNSSADALVG
jgi:hypothetical protein